MIACACISLFMQLVNFEVNQFLFGLEESLKGTDIVLDSTEPIDLFTILLGGIIKLNLSRFPPNPLKDRSNICQDKQCRK